MRQVIAWTGGSSPRPWADISTDERTLARTLFAAQYRDYRAAWDADPDSKTLELLWNRARHDAHATFRGDA